MKFLTLLFTLFALSLSAQETPKICTKTIVIKPLFIESEETIDVPEVVEWKCIKNATEAEYKTVPKMFILRDGFFDIVDKWNVGTQCYDKCRVWVSPEVKTYSTKVLMKEATAPIYERVVTKVASKEIVIVKKKQRDGEVKIVETDCN